MTERYCIETARALARDYNAYKKMKYSAACEDYRTALDNIIYVAGIKGWKIEYTVSKAGYIEIR